ncbi:hypothetical protein AALP_AAs72293U000200 [Arabis alpina]|uniref:Myb-like domain-containing protein n=1 Tax=Arabis alpina TaxID=50452 RepID=A0A087FWK4_ARAAL|nr:hypothetical protein AALP_AAs72293U000200 [Arabis alpina]
MDNTNRLHDRRNRNHTKITLRESEEVSSIKWEFINMTEQEEDLIFRMHRLVGDRWDLIAGRVAGREAKEIERYWIMKNSDYFSNTRLQLHSLNTSPHSSISHF